MKCPHPPEPSKMPKSLPLEPASMPTRVFAFCRSITKTIEHLDRSVVVVIGVVFLLNAIAGLVVSMDHAPDDLRFAFVLSARHRLENVNWCAEFLACCKVISITLQHFFRPEAM